MSVKGSARSRVRTTRPDWRPFSKKGNAEHRAEPTYFLRSGPGVLRICLNIGNVYDLCLNQGSAGSRSSVPLDGTVLKIVGCL